MSKPKISISLLALNFDSVSDFLQQLHPKIGIHIDFMDGTYSNSLGLPSSWKINSNHYTTHHYMTQNIYSPENADSICVHFSKSFLLSKYKNHNRGVWLTKYEELENIENIDYICLLCVTPGFCGQSFNLESWNEAKLLEKYNKEIQLDGGINDTNIKKALNRNYSVVTGSYGVQNIDHICSLI